MTRSDKTSDYSVLRLCVVRPLHIAVAQQLAQARPGTSQWNTLLRVYGALSAEQQQNCRFALMAQRKPGFEAIDGHWFPSR